MTHASADHVIASIAIHTLTGASQTTYLKQALEILTMHDLHPQYGPMSTIVEGDFEQILRAVSECRKKLHAAGAQKLEMRLDISSRIDKPLTIRGRLTEMQLQ